MINFFKKSETVGEVLATISDADKTDFFGFGIVLNDDKTIYGITTLKDISINILKNSKILNQSIDKYCIKDFIFVTLNDDGSYNKLDALKKIADRDIKSGKVRFVPILDSKKKLIDVKAYDDIFAVTENYSVAIYGMGFVGLTLFAALSSRGFNCVGFENSNEKLDMIKKGVLPVLEEGLDELFFNLKLGDKVFTNSAEAPETNTKIICVGTDINSDNEIDKLPLKNVVSQIASELKYGDLIILRSTVQVGCTNSLVIPILEKESGLRAGIDFHVGFCPERTIEGKALIEIQELPQIIGGLTSNCVEKSRQLFDELASNTVITESLEAAELVKLLNNSFRDLSFAFSNEIIKYADQYNIDASKLVKDANFQYPRNKIAQPSPGVGGYCLTKDPYIYHQTSSKNENSLSLIGRQINDEAQHYPYKKFVEHCKKRKIDISKMKIGVLGIAFKGIPNTNDVRGSCGLKLAQDLSEITKEVHIFDPNIESLDMSHKFHFSSSKSIILNCDAVFIMNNNPNLIGKDWNLFADKDKDFFMFDGWLGLIDSIPVSFLKNITFCSLGKVY